jgi:N-hydroxyarylamine O-acetyltransferase
MVLLVKLPEGDHLADLGFGRLTLTAPLLWQPDIEQRAPHGVYRVTRVGSEFQLQIRHPDRFVPLYQVSPEEQDDADWEVANWFSSTHPESIFTNNLIVARPVGDLIYTLMNHRLSIHHPDGSVHRHTTEGRELIALLELRFGIRLPDGFEDVIERLPPGS